MDFYDGGAGCLKNVCICNDFLKFTLDQFDSFYSERHQEYRIILLEDRKNYSYLDVIDFPKQQKGAKFRRKFQLLVKKNSSQ